MTQELDNKQKKEWAKLLFLTTDLTQAEIAVKIGVSRITIVRWAKEWEGLKLNFLQTREARIKSTLIDLEKAKMLSDYFDSYIQERLKWVK